MSPEQLRYFQYLHHSARVRHLAPVARLSPQEDELRPRDHDHPLVDHDALELVELLRHQLLERLGREGDGCLLP